MFNVHTISFTHRKANGRERELERKNSIDSLNELANGQIEKKTGYVKCIRKSIFTGLL